MADEMLAAALGALQIEKRDMQTTAMRNADHHVLRFAYPDFSIALEPNEDVEMTVPSHVEHRSRPPKNSRDLALYDADFAIALPLQRHGQGNRSYSEVHMQLIAAVEALKTSGGTTTLGVLRVHKEIWDVRVYRIRIETQSASSTPHLPPLSFELEEEEWAALVKYADQRAWIGVLKHLVDRASAKAYYHVRQRLIARIGPSVIEEEEKWWLTTWGTKREVYAQDLFLSHLTTVPDNVVAGKMPHLMLKCGHGYSLTCNEATNVKPWEMFHQVCNECKKPIMTAADKQHLDALVDKKDALKFAKMQRVWANLVRDVKEPNKPRRFHALSIFRVLGAALESLRSPEWVAPTALCPSKFDETQEVLDHLESMFWDNHEFYERTATMLLEDLETEALGVRIDDVPLSERANPPGWDDFVARWLRRTAYFLAYRRCAIGGPNCNGLHGHGDGLWYSPEEWEKAQAEYHEKSESRFDTSELMRALDTIQL